MLLFSYPVPFDTSSFTLKKERKMLAASKELTIQRKKKLSRKDQVGFHIHSQHTIISTGNKEHYGEINCRMCWMTRGNTNYYYLKSKIYASKGLQL